MSHESPLQQQHDSIEQQLSVAFFWSVCDGVVVWAVPAVNAVSIKPRKRIKVVFLRDFIVILLYQEISALRAGQTHQHANEEKSCQADLWTKSGKHNTAGG